MTQTHNIEADLPATVSADVFGSVVYGFGRDKSYKEATELGAIRFGRLLRVPVLPALKKVLGDDREAIQEMWGRLRDAENAKKAGREAA